jgi:drug/metabolite transporter (DMT)-like permease
MKPSAFSTAGGLVAVVLWGSYVAVARSVSEQLGPYTAALFLNATAAILLSLPLVFRAEARKTLGKTNPRYLAVCGLLFVLNGLGLNLAVGLAASRIQAVEISVINYLWPSLTLALSVPILAKRSRWTLIPGVLLAFCGIAVVSFGPSGFAPGDTLRRLAVTPVPYLLALMAAVTWALYSNLARKLGGETGGSGVALFFWGAAIASLALRLCVNETSHWSPRVMAEVAYAALAPTTLAFALWDTAMRRGNMVLIAAVSYFIPLISAGLSVAYLGAPVHPSLWVGCCLVVVGAILSRAGIRG